MAQEYSQVNFRIPSKLKEDIEKAAFANNRSITSELVSRLEQSFEQNQNDFNAGYNACMAHMIIATSKALSEKDIPWVDVQKTLIEVIDDFQKIANKKAP